MKKTPDSLELLFKSQCLEKRFLLESTIAIPDVLAKAALRISNELLHIYNLLHAQNALELLRRMQVSCLVQNLDAINKIEPQLEGKSPYIKFKLMLRDFISRFSEEDNVLSPSKLAQITTLIEDRGLELVQAILQRLFIAEQDGGLICILSDKAYDESYKLVDSLLLGKWGGPLPVPNDTYVPEVMNTYFDALWNYFINALKIHPFGCECLTDYDEKFYAYCQLLQNKNDTIMLNVKTQLLNLDASAAGYALCLMSDLHDNDLEKAESHKIYLSEEGIYCLRDTDGVLRYGIFTHLYESNAFDSDLPLQDSHFKASLLALLCKNKHIHQEDSRDRLIRAFHILDVELANLLPVDEQAEFKRTLLPITAQYGFTQLLTYDATQRRVVEERDNTLIREFTML
ncbi:MAG: hypothetical protein M3R00_02320 [Pseudomonadota bacterium]|nr:hypothetical protein [Pseudomonadota bacterium]